MHVCRAVLARAELSPNQQQQTLLAAQLETPPKKCPPLSSFFLSAWCAVRQCIQERFSQSAPRGDSRVIYILASRAGQSVGPTVAWNEREEAALPCLALPACLAAPPPVERRNYGSLSSSLFYQAQNAFLPFCRTQRRQLPRPTLVQGEN